MTDKDQQLEHLRAAVERKAGEAEARSHDSDAMHHGGPPPGDEDASSQRSRVETGRPQDVMSIRDKNAGKGKKTADKWNQ